MHATVQPYSMHAEFCNPLKVEVLVASKLPNSFSMFISVTA